MFCQTLLQEFVLTRLRKVSVVTMSHKYHIVFIWTNIYKTEVEVEHLGKE